MLAELQDLLGGHAVAEELAGRFGLDVGGLRPVESLMSAVYLCERAAAPCVLKVTHTLHRSEANLLGEVGFVNHLADHGLDVPRALPSLAGRFVETAPAREGTVLAYAFERAKGEPIPEGEWTPRLLEDWGALMGRIHALGASWRPPAEVQRPLWHWDELDYFDRYIPPEAGPVRRRAADLMGRLLALPTGPDVFGMVHGDLHPWNFFRHEGGLSPFDFDDCARDWFIKDLASALYYALEAPPAPSSPAEWSERFRYLKHHLVTGYRREHSLSEEWLVRQLPDFLLRASLFDYVETVRLEAAGAPEQEFRTREALTEEIERDLWRDARFWS